MRTLMNMKDLLQVGNQAEQCPQCPDDTQPLRAVQCIVDWRKGRFFVRKTMNCPTHGAFTTVTQVKTVLLHGKDATTQ